MSLSLIKNDFFNAQTGQAVRDTHLASFTAAILAFHLSIMNLHTRQKLNFFQKRIPLIAIIFSLNRNNRAFGEDFFFKVNVKFWLTAMFVMETDRLNHICPWLSSCFARSVESTET